MRGVKPDSSQTSTSCRAAARAARDPGLPGQLADGDARRLRQPVPLRDQADQPVGEQRPDHQVVPFAAGAPVTERQRDVAVALAQQVHRARRLGLDERHPGAGVFGAQGGQRPGDQGGAAAGEGDQPDPAGPQPGDGGDLLLGRGQPREDAGGVPYQRLAGLGEAHLASGTDQQRGARGGLQGLHLLADGGLGAAEFAGCGGERAGGGHGAQDTEVASFDHPAIIRNSWGPGEFATGTFGAGGG